MLTIDQIFKSARLENQTTQKDNRNFSEPHYRMPSSYPLLHNKDNSVQNKENKRKYSEKNSKQS
jgi:hypothetical protein